MEVWTATLEWLRDKRSWPVAGVAGIGCLTVISFVWQLLSYALIFARPSRLPRYRHSGVAGQAAWALVTGASDGIGKSLVAELAGHGYNVVLHGRNAKKLEGVRFDLGRRFPDREFRTLILDAADSTDTASAMARVSEELGDLNLTVLINNVGGGPSNPTFGPLEAFSTDDIVANVHMNALFPTLLTSTLLPTLIRSSPSLVVFVGSMADHGMPMLSFYAASKSFEMTLSLSVARESAMRRLGVDVLSVRLGAVSGTSHVKGPTSFFEPTPTAMARSILARVGCGRRIVIPYFPHALQEWLTKALPAPALERAFVTAIQTRMDADANEAKKA